MAAVQEDAAFLAAKALLLKSDGDQVSAYDHLTEVLLKVLETKPSNPVESIEKISQEVKRTRMKNPVSARGSTRRLATAKSEVYNRQSKLFEDGDDAVSTTGDGAVPNIVKDAHIFEQCGLGLGKDEVMHIQMAVRKLLPTLANVSSVRFWGKINGTKADYYVLEGTPVAGVDIDEEEKAAEDEAALREKVAAKEIPEVETPVDGEDVLEIEDAPVSQYKPPQPIPRETMIGTNKLWYWVTTEPGRPWVKLPSVSPHHITVARQIKKLMTGNLDAPVHSYPPFKGSEKHLLRAQIARISAATVVSPAGYFAFPEEDEEEDRVVVEAVADYEGMSLQELTKASSWCHHIPVILPQGRCHWFSTQKEPADDDEEVDEDEEPPEEIEPEVGAPMLTSCDQDASCAPENDSAWSAKTYPSHSPDIVLLKSNNWPGAYAIATERGSIFRNVYFGWGQKHRTNPFVPPAIQSAQEECNVVLTQVADPSVEEEMALEEEQEEKEGNDLGDNGDDSEDDD